MNLENREPRPRYRPGERGKGQAVTRDNEPSTYADQERKDDRESDATAMIDHPPACRKARDVVRLLELLDGLPRVADGQEGDNR